MRTFSVTLPVSGIARLSVQAETEEEAIEKALNVVTLDHLEEWEAMETIVQGNVVYALQPWEAEAEDEGPAA